MRSQNQLATVLGYLRDMIMKVLHFLLKPAWQCLCCTLFIFILLYWHCKTYIHEPKFSKSPYFISSLNNYTLQYCSDSQNSLISAAQALWKAARLFTLPPLELHTTTSEVILIFASLLLNISVQGRRIVSHFEYNLRPVELQRYKIPRPLRQFSIILVSLRFSPFNFKK